MLFDEKNKINKTIPIPLYFQLKELIMNEIKMEEYPVGSTIPIETDISSHFDLSRTTVRQAITELVNEGWLNRKKGKGTFVSRPSLNQDFIQRLEKYNDQIKRLGMTPHTEVVDVKIEDASEEVADKLQINAGDKVIFLKRRRFADNLPIVIVDTYLPYHICQFVLDKDLKLNSLYDILSEKEKTKVVTSLRIVQAVGANEEVSELLGISKGSPVQFFESISSNAFGDKIEYSQASYRGDKNKFMVTVNI